MRAIKFILAGVLGASLLAAGPVIYSNLGPSLSYLNNGVGAGSTSPFGLATTFTATGSGQLLQVLVPVEDTHGTVGMGLYADNGGKPGALIEAWNNIVVNNTFASPAPLVTTASVLQPTLTAGSTYWFFVLSAAGNPNTDGLEWGNSSQISSGGDWFGGPSNVVLQFPTSPPPAIELDAVGGAIAAPEPGTLALFTTALILILRRAAGNSFSRSL